MLQLYFSVWNLTTTSNMDAWLNTDLLLLPVSWFCSCCSSILLSLGSLWIHFYVNSRFIKWNNECYAVPLLAESCDPSFLLIFYSLYCYGLCYGIARWNIKTLIWIKFVSFFFPSLFSPSRIRMTIILWLIGCPIHLHYCSCFNKVWNLVVQRMQLQLKSHLIPRPSLEEWQW